jgi:hypothetical protein
MAGDNKRVKVNIPIETLDGMTTQQQQGIQNLITTIVAGAAKESLDMSPPSTSIKPTGSNQVESSSNVRGV